MFELSTSSLNASWWMVDSCTARIGEQGMRLGFSVQREKGREGERERGREGERERGEMEREGEIERERERGREGERVLMLEPSASYFNAPWWMVDSCTASIGASLWSDMSG